MTVRWGLGRARSQRCLASLQVRTDVVRNSVCPKFLKDVRMNVPSPETDVLRVRMGPELERHARGWGQHGLDPLPCVADTQRPAHAVGWPQMELLQVGPKGDLVVGTTELRILSIANKGTVVHWFDLRAFDDEVGAELCLVLRFLSGAQSRGTGWGR